MSNANQWRHFVDYEPWHTLMRETREQAVVQLAEALAGIDTI